jgi:hypothetical protein
MRLILALRSRSPDLNDVTLPDGVTGIGGECIDEPSLPLFLNRPWRPQVEVNVRFTEGAAKRILGAVR